MPIPRNESTPKIIAAYPMKKERNHGRRASSEALMVPSEEADVDSRGVVKLEDAHF